MPNRIPIEVNDFVHVYNRGTEKRDIFESDVDRQRFVDYLDILNDSDVLSPSRCGIQRKQTDRRTDEPLVSLVAYCLMPNHYHLVLQERNEGGLSRFMQRLGVAYTNYFNETRERTGVLFQGKYKARVVMDEQYLLTLIHYVHMNPIGLLGASRTVSAVRMCKMLTGYQWSSLQYFVYGGNCKMLQGASVFGVLNENPNEYESLLIEAIRSRMDLGEDLGPISIDYNTNEHQK